MSLSRWEQYISGITKNFIKVCRMEFLQPDGSVAFFIDNNATGKKSRAFLQDGSLSVNFQNGTRRTATVRLANIDDEYEYNVNNVWFGTQVRILMGIRLLDGTDYLIPQGTFVVRDPETELNPSQKTVTYNLVDKWANLDGTLGGQLEGIYEVSRGTNIFSAMDSILKLDRRTHNTTTDKSWMIDNAAPVFTSYYNGKTSSTGDPLNETPQILRYDSDGQTYADVVLGLNEVVAGVIGYDSYGSLRVDPSQDDILDINKPVQWTFDMKKEQFLGATYTIQNSEVKNDIIRVGQALNDGNAMVGGRATNYDPRSDTNVNLIGLYTDRQTKAGYATSEQCAWLAEFELKRNTILKKAISIKSTQMFHLVENNVIAIRREDKYGAPYERHLINGFTIPISQRGEMTISAVSVLDMPNATVSELSYE